MLAMMGGDAAMMSRLVRDLQIVALGILLVLAIGIGAVLYRNLRETRH
jgi:hypothetical protein